MKMLLTLSMLLVLVSLSAQNHNYYWKTAYGSTPTTTAVGGVDIDFNVVPPDTSYVFRAIDFINNSATICDAQGNLLFSSNGCNRKK
jgi:hypothetical protein